MVEKNWLVIINENMYDADARVDHEGHAYPLRPWERLWSAHDTKAEAEAELAKAREYASGRRLS